MLFDKLYYLLSNSYSYRDYYIQTVRLVGRTLRFYFFFLLLNEDLQMPCIYLKNYKKSLSSYRLPYFLFKDGFCYKYIVSNFNFFFYRFLIYRHMYTYIYNHYKNINSKIYIKNSLNIFYEGFLVGRRGDFFFRKFLFTKFRKFKKYRKLVNQFWNFNIRKVRLSYFFLLKRKRKLKFLINKKKINYKKRKLKLMKFRIIKQFLYLKN